MKQILVTLLVAGTVFAQSKGTTSKAAAPSASLTNPSSLKAKAPPTFDVKFTTTKGDFVVHVTRAWAPYGADRFYNLVKAGFFDGCAFFRVLKSPRPFMAQFGISPSPAVAAAWKNANLPDDKVMESNKRGRITFATAGPNTRTTQLFINFGDNGFLDNQGFAPFGEVTEGMSVVDSINGDYGEQPDQGKIQAEGKGYLDRYFPKLDKIIKATIVPAAAPAAKSEEKK
jgi:peptidyl-prolyl cis-trans isomerase A (cyclophilin A)